MVHRDLAARNVLVKRTNYVEVTDFGLAKMLKKDEESVEVSGKVAPKWLAIECFEKRAFNEPTDVWAFGVTCWEVLTKGCVPYKNMAVDQMRRFLEDGNRLETPNNVSQELYSLLLLCWLSHPRTRPSFSQLKSKLEEFCRQPNRYLKDVNSKDMALSTRDRRIAESYSDPFAAGDSDDEPNDDPDFPGFPSESPRDSPPSPSKPLLPRNQRLQSRESERYDTDPVYKGRPGNSVRIVDDYLEPRGREAAQMNPAEIYTPVIDEETGRTELYNENAYYNEPAAQKKPLYENEALRAAPKDATYVNDEMRTVSNPCYVTDPVPQKETAL
uniref:receptor protein-tyrosine kinase n=1 Tax=Steinernema glaseri TaxID=37863 RepID=A0A1I8ACG1_9BILA